MLCLQFLAHEAGYDRWGPALERTARVEVTITPPGGEPIRTVGSSRGMAPWLRSLRHPAIESVTSFTQKQVTAYVDGVKVSELATFADSDFLRTITLPWRGAAPARLAPNEMLISSGAARRQFGAASPIGKIVTVPNIGAGHYTIVGVFELPSSTHFNFEWVLPRDPQESTPTRAKEDWLSLGDYTYVRMKTADGLSQLEPLIRSTADNQIDAVTAGGAVLPPSKVWSFVVEPVRDIHLHAQGQGALRPGGDVRVLQLIGVLTACIALVVIGNLTNQALLLNMRRSRELAVRQLVGESRRAQTLRTVAEVSILSALGLLAAWAAAALIGPALGKKLGVGSSWDLENFRRYAGWCLLAIGLVSLGTGLATAASEHHRSVSSLLLRGVGGHVTSVRFRTVLFSLQLALGASLAASCVFAWQQLDHLQNTPSGLSVKGGMVLLDARYHHNFNDQLSTLRAEIERVPGVRSATFVGDVPGRPMTTVKSVAVDGVAAEMAPTAAYLSVTPSFIDALNIRLIAGRFISEAGDFLIRHGNRVTESDAAMVINVSLASRLGFKTPAEAVGTRVRLVDPKATLRIVGVTEDFRYAGMQLPAEPIMMVLDEDSIGHGLVMLHPDASAQTGTQVLATFDRLMPGEGLRLESLEAIWNQQFARVETLALLSALLVLTVAILICGGVVTFVSVLVRANAKLSALMRLHGAGWWRCAVSTLRSSLAAGALASGAGVASACWLLAEWSRQFVDRAGLLPAAGLAFVAVVGIAVLAALVVHRFQERHMSLAEQLRAE